MRCPNCGAPSGCLETRRVAGNMSRRRRRCADDNCGFKFTTIEAVVDSNEHHNNAVLLIVPKHVARAMRSALSALQRVLGPELAENLGGESSGADTEQSEDAES